MKKNLCFLLCILFFCAIPVRAAQPPLTATGSAAVPGQNAYVTLRFNETVIGDSIAVTYTWDKTCLEPIPDNCTWSRKGTLQDFDHAGGVGVWTVAEAADLTGDICVLTFRVPANAKFTQTTVKCTVLVKNDGATVGSYQAEATFGQACDHQYGSWQNASNSQHKQVCSKCDHTAYEDHNWIDGQILDIPDNPDKKLKVLFCTVCKATREVEVSTDSLPDSTTSGIPGDPDPDMTQAATEPVQNTPDSTGTQNQTGSQNNSGAQNQTGSNQIPGGTAQDTPATNAQDSALPSGDSHEGHNHETSPTGAENSPLVTACIILAVATLLIGGAVFLVKRKK